MATVYSTRVYCASSLSGFVAAIYTVPDGYVFVLRDVEVLNSSGSAESVVLLDDATGAALAGTPAVTGLLVGSWQGRVVCPAGSAFSAYSDSTDYSLQVSGYLLAV